MWPGELSFLLCVRVRALVCVLCTGVWHLHGYYLSYLFSVLATGQPATCEVVWGSLLSPRLWARHQVCSWPTIMRKAVRGAAYHTDSCSLVSGKGLGSGLPCVCIVGASVPEYSKSPRFFHVYSTYLYLKVFLCAHAWPCVFAFTPCLVWFVQGEKLKVQTRRAPRCLFWGSITTGISHSSKKAV